MKDSRETIVDKLISLLLLVSLVAMLAVLVSVLGYILDWWDLKIPTRRR